MSKVIRYNEEDVFERDNDASSSVFGYLFQAKAALWFFISNITTASSIKVETKKQDIELLFSDGSKYYIQAKAQQRYSTNDNAGLKLQTALTSLSTTLINNTDKLVYVNNLKWPLSVIGDEQLRFNVINYNNLSPDNKNIVNSCIDSTINSLKTKIEEAQKEDKALTKGQKRISRHKLVVIKKQLERLDKNKLLFANLYPCSEVEENDLVNDISLKFADLNISIDNTKTKNVFQNWIKMLLVSEQSSDRVDNQSKKVVSKDTFSWAIASELLSGQFNYDELISLGVLRQINAYGKQRTRQLVEDGLFNSEGWIICNKIINEYEDFYKNTGGFDSDFINLKWRDYLDAFSPCEEEDDVREAFTRYKIFCIISKNSTITKIQRKIRCES